MAANAVSFHNRRPLESAFRYSSSVRTRDTLYIAGTVSWDHSGVPLHVGSVAAQMREVYGEIAEILQAHQCTPADILKETLYTTDLALVAENAGIRADFYGAGSGPASTWVEVRRLVHPDLLIEVDMIVRRPRSVGRRQRLLNLTAD